MADIWNYFKDLFKQSETSSKQEPFIHELISRTKEERLAFEAWKEKLVARRMLDWLRDQYAIYNVLPKDIDEALDFLNTPSSKGFVIHFNKTNYSREDATHFTDWMKEKVRSLEYRTQISDTKSYQKSNYIETLERHYLKPRPDFQKNVPIKKDHFNQRYGNVLIELVLRDDRPYQLRFSATVYNDHFFKEADEFALLMEKVLI